jgi:hypothetical protein
MLVIILILIQYLQYSSLLIVRKPSVVTACSAQVMSLFCNEYCFIVPEVLISNTLFSLVLLGSP